MLFQDLPADLLTYLIQTSIEPIDIISLRQTCRALYTATLARTVWRSALQRMCIDHRLFQPTFPIDTMTADELESAALSPFRFSTLMDTSPENTLEPAVTRMFEPSRVVTDGEDDCSELVLIPGGRFLVTEHGGICLWDLGQNTACYRLPSAPIAVYSPEDGIKISILGAIPAPDGLGIRVIAAHGTTTISVSEINPLAVNPQFQFIRRLRLKAPLHLHAISGDRVALLDDEAHISVWNLTSNLAVTWKLASPDPASDTVIFGEHVLVLRQTGISVLTIPTFQHKPNHHLDAKILEHQITTEIAHPFNNLRGAPPLLAAPSGWWPPSLDHIYLGLASPMGRNLSMSLYKLELDQSHPSGNDDAAKELFATDKLVTQSPRRTPFYARIALPPMTLCHGQLSQSWALSGEVLTSLMLPEPGETNGCSAVTKSLYAYELQERVLYDFCPASGRLVVATGGEIRVLDFLEPLDDC